MSNFVYLNLPAVFVYHLYKHKSSSNNGEFFVADRDKVFHVLTLYVVLARGYFKRETLFFMHIRY